MRVIRLSVCLVFVVVVGRVTTLHAEMLYASDYDSLYTVDTATGATALIGSHGTLDEEMGAMELANGVLYGLTLSYEARLYTIDTDDGAASAIGPLGIGFVFEGGLAWDGDTMWGVNVGESTNCNLFSVNLTSGAATTIGIIGDGNHDFGGLAFDGGNLYGVDRITNALWLIDTDEPANSTQVGAGLGDDILMGDFGGMAGSIAYASGSNTIFSIDLVTGIGTPLSSPETELSALAPIPEPGTMALLAIAGLRVFRRNWAMLGQRDGPERQLGSAS